MAERLSAFMDRQRVAKMTEAYAKLARLEAEGTARQNRIFDLQQRAIPELEKAVAAAPTWVNDAVNARARGVATDDAVDAARNKQRDIIATLDHARSELQSLRSSGNMDLELLHAKHAAAEARQTLVGSVIDDIAATIRSDSRLLERLDLVYAALCSTPDAGVGLIGVRFDWTAALAGIFPEPDETKHEAIMAKHTRDMPAKFQAAA